MAPVWYSVLIGVDIFNSSDAAIFAGQGNLRIMKEFIAETVRYNSRSSICSAVLVDENCWLQHENEIVTIVRVQTPHAETLAFPDTCDDGFLEKFYLGLTWYT